MRCAGTVLLAALVMALCDPAMALRDSVQGLVTKSDDAEIVVAFGEHDQSRTDGIVISGFCQLHWGVLSLGSDGSAIWKFEVSSLNDTDRWEGQFVLHDKEDNVLGTVPNSGTFDIQVREVRPRRMEIIIPLRFDPADFTRIGSVKMSIECRPKDA